MEIGKHIRFTRKKALLTIDDLSKLSGVSSPTIGKIEKGHQNIDLEKLALVCDALDKKFKLTLVNK